MKKIKVISSTHSRPRGRAPQDTLGGPRSNIGRHVGEETISALLDFEI
jgi:hypothetical protein